MVKKLGNDFFVSQSSQVVFYVDFSKMWIQLTMSLNLSISYKIEFAIIFNVNSICLFLKV